MKTLISSALKQEETVEYHDYVAVTGDMWLGSGRAESKYDFGHGDGVRTEPLEGEVIQISDHEDRKLVLLRVSGGYTRYVVCDSIVILHRQAWRSGFCKKF